MRTMKIEKKLLFSETINEVNQMEVKAALVYQKENDGSIRTTGPLFIHGTMRLENGEVQKFQEVLDMDVLAPAFKLSEEPFSIKVKEYYANCEEDGIALVINMNIYGLKEEAQERIALPQEEMPPVYPLPTIQPLDCSTVNAAQEVEVMKEQVDPVDATSVEEFEDLFEEGETTYTPYRMIVAKPQDSYSSIAKRYEVNEEDLRATNRNKELQEKALVVLPFAKVKS